jgi:hypothetical protein
MKEKTRVLVDRVGTDVSGKWIAIDKMESLVSLVVEECVTAVNNSPRHSAYTTYDLELIDNMLSVAINNINKSFK